MTIIPGYAYSTDALLALQGKPFYDINLGWGFQLLFTLSSQLIGIGLAGLARRFLVWPAAMICMLSSIPKSIYLLSASGNWPEFAY